VAPPVAARKLATLDQLSDGRLAVHIIAGASDADQAKDGDWTDHGARYRRSAEYMSLLRRTWTEPAPFDHQGEFYRTQGTYAEIRCRQQPHIPIYGGGGSDAAIRALAGPACRCLHALGRTAEGYSPVYGSRAPGGRTHRPQPDLQPFNPPDPRGNRGQSLGPGQGHSGPGADQSGWRAGAKAPERRLPTASAGGRGCRGARHLWTSLAVATGAQGNSTALVGTPETVAKAMLEYYKLGATGLLIRGYDPRPDAVQYGEDLIPRLRKLVADYDAGNDAGNDAASDTAGVAFRSGRPGCNAAH
jgi:alkanesulfonate monooxygenase